jgi:carboxypeptidase family protein
MNIESAEVSVAAQPRTPTWLTQRLTAWTPHLSRLQMLVGISSGLISIIGALYTIPAVFRPPAGTGEIVAIVREAKTEKAIADAKVEILTPQNAVITTMLPNNLGKTRYSLAEGEYRIRVSHAHFGSEARQVHVVRGQTAEVHVQLRRLAPSPISHAESAIRDVVGNVRRLFTP